MHKNAIEHAKQDALIYDKSFEQKEGMENKDVKDKSNVNDTIEMIKNKNMKEISKDTKSINLNFYDKEQIEKETEKVNEINKSFQKVEKTYKYKYYLCNPLEEVKKITKFVEDVDEKHENISNGVLIIKEVYKKGNKNKKLIRMRYNGIKKVFMNEMRIYLTNRMPSILNIVGYHIGKRNQDIFIENKGNISLEICLNQIRFNLTNKLIIAYGVARAMKFLHMNNIVHRNLKPAVIMLDNKFHPYVSEFYFAKQIDTKSSFLLKESTPEFMAPEFINDFKSNQNSFKIDVYSYGITLFMLLTQINPFLLTAPADILTNTIKGKRPKFPSNFNENWKKLISDCWNENPTKRPSFEDICEKLESTEFVNASINILEFKKYKNLFN